MKQIIYSSTTYTKPVLHLRSYTCNYKTDDLQLTLSEEELSTVSVIKFSWEFSSDTMLAQSWLTTTANNLKVQTRAIVGAN